MRARHALIRAGLFVGLLLQFNDSPAQCQYGGNCTGLPHTTGVPGAAGAAAGILGIGVQMLMQQSIENQSGVAPPTAPSAVQAPGSTDSSASQVTPDERRSLLNQLRPLGRGSYGASDPGTSATTDAAINQIAPTTGDANTLQSQKTLLLEQMRPIGSAEAASQGARAPFDTASPNGVAHTAADQLCQAAGKGPGCIRTPPRVRQTATVARTRSTDIPGGAIPIGNTTIVSPDRTSCGIPLSIDRPVALGRLVMDPHRDAGYPIASTLDELRALGYSDMRANLAAMKPEQLAKLRLLAHQETVRISTTLNVVHERLFSAEIGAMAPVPSYSRAAKEAAFEAVKDIAPFWRQMEALGKGRAKADTDTVAGYIDETENFATERDIVNGKLLGALRGVMEEHHGLGELVKHQAGATLETILAVDSASKGDKGKASEHAGKAVQHLLPVSSWIVPESALPRLAQWQAYLTIGLIVIDTGFRAREAYAGPAEAESVRAQQEQSMRDVSLRVDALKGKLHDIEQLQNLITQDPRCN